MPEPYIDKKGKKRIPSVYFKNHHKQLPLPFTIYADFESVTEKIKTCQPSNQKSYTEKYQIHTACSFSYKVVCHYDIKYSKPEVIFRGNDAAYKFLASLFLEVHNLKKVIRENFNKPLNLTQEEEEFQRSTNCWICNKKYKEDQKPVRDHCHITGKYRGSAHESCNLKLQISPHNIKIPVIIHNLKGYDSHLIMQYVGQIIKDENEKIAEENKRIAQENEENKKNTKFIPKMELKVIAQNSEKYMAFYLGKHFIFLDSFQFMSSSLEKLAANLPEDKFIYTKEYFADERQFQLMKSKGVYPYDYMDSFDKFNERQLPKKGRFL